MRHGAIAILLMVGLFVCLPSSGWAVQATKVALSEQEINAAVLQAVQQKVAGRGWDVRLRRISTPSNISVPVGMRELELVPSSQWDGWGTANMALLVRVNGHVERNLPIRVEIEALADMVVARHQLAAGAILTPDDLLILKQDVAIAQGRFITAIDEAVGKKIRTSVRQNAPLRSDQLDRVPVIKTGQLITIVAESSTIRIAASGRARSSGAIGDLIMVQNLGSSRELPAKVLDASTVLVGF